MNKKTRYKKNKNENVNIIFFVNPFFQNKNLRNIFCFWILYPTKKYGKKTIVFPKVNKLAK